ncbi:MAG: alpha/beta hydrolase [Burkholderiaceae bacterium]|nr:alpha/beta hydrolase [Burkholderiaceae bacterium]
MKVPPADGPRPTASSGSRPAPFPIPLSDLRGFARLGVEATVGLTDLVEAVHHAVESTLGLADPDSGGRTSGITGFVYRRVRGVTRWVGLGLDGVLGVLADRILPAPSEAAVLPEREAVRSALNGLWGDHLAQSGNPLAIPMRLRIAGRPLDLGAPLAAQLPATAGGRVLLLVHGLCMNDLQWSRRGHDHGQMLAGELGATALYLHYNTGRHVSENGRELAALLESLVARWPVPIQELVIVGHSMGGLVTRSACHIAQASSPPWLGRLKALVFLGTPHHGAPLERGGRLVDQALGRSRHVRPFARLGRSRSAGITDLRYGNLQDADWQGRNRHAQRRDDRRPTPLPDGVAVHLVAAVTAARASERPSWRVGDGLVPLASALGRHRDPALALSVPTADRCVVTGANHWDLLDHPDVAQALRRWLACPAPT